MLARRVVVAVVVVVVGLGLAQGILALFTDLEWSALSGTEALILGAALVAPLLVIAAVLVVRGIRIAARHAYVADLGMRGTREGAQGVLDGSVYAALMGTFETPDGERRPAWIVAATGRPALSELVIQPRSAQVPDYASAMPAVNIPGLPHTLAAWSSTDPVTLDPAVVADLATLPELIQVRVQKGSARVMLERPADPRSVRSAVKLARTLIGRPLPSSDREPAGMTSQVFERSLPRASIAMGAALAWIVAVIVVANLAPDAEGYEDFILTRARSCNLAREALGEPIVRRQLGLQPSTQQNRNITSRLLVKGSRAAGTIVVHAYKRTRGTPSAEYPLIDALLDTSAGTIDLLSCSRHWKQGITAPVARRARVRSAAKPANLAVGVTCTVTVTTVLPPTFQECRVEIACDGKKLYGSNPNVGFTDCWTVTDRGRPEIVASDPDRGTSMPEPTLELDERLGTVQLGGPGRPAITLELVDE